MMAEPYPGYEECCGRWKATRDAIPNDRWSKDYAASYPPEQPTEPPKLSLWQFIRWVAMKAKKWWLTREV